MIEHTCLPSPCPLCELPPRLAAKVSESESGCWTWTAYRNKCGYGVFNYEKKTWLAHRLTYTLLRGQIPEGLTLDHLCRVRECVNPGHLEPVTLHANILRGETIAAANLAKTECANGHPYDEKNTWYDKKGFRHCKACMVTYRQRWAAKRKAA